ncbi:MAG: N-acetylmuramoyl-L-alanine amidase [Pseudomonadota bacterium]
MIRSFFLMSVLLWAVLPAVLSAQPLTGVARVDMSESIIKTDWRGRIKINLRLSQGVPFRVFTLENPARLVLDFREIDWSGVKSVNLLRDTSGVSDVRFGAFQPRWSRLVADLTGPFLPRDVGMVIDPVTGAADLTLVLDEVARDVFSAASGVPEDVPWPESSDSAAPPLADDRFVVVLDPGHGGIDPGAEREGITEKALMLEMALALRETLIRTADVDVVMTRDRDVFVSLEARVAKAHQVNADVFLSLHADALSQGGARGATVYLLSDEASDTASAHLAARHNRADIIAGADLTGADDEVTSLLLDLARQETEPRSEALARTLIEGLTRAGGPMNSRPLRRAGFSVLKSADIPSALIEVGFLSSKRDLANLRDPAWRAGIIDAMARAILAWHRSDQAVRQLVRQ